MLTKLRVRNFKVLEDVEIELGPEPVVFVGPNNSGKTSALQALALWSIGVKRWIEKRPKGTQRTGVAINRKDLLAVPVPNAKLLWRDLRVRNVDRAHGSQKTTNILMEITVEGVSEGVAWTCGMQFDYQNEESFYCRPIPDKQPGRNAQMVMEYAGRTEVAFLPPMSGLAPEEYLKQRGEINVLVGRGQTAEVLRNLCFLIASTEDETAWKHLKALMTQTFGVFLGEPEYSPERGEIILRYTDYSKNELDISCAGRGLQQTLLLLAHIYSNPGSVLLIDEPDAHLEILRQRQTYGLISNAAKEQGAQIICATHSEVVLNEAAGKDTVVAFVGKPHRIDNSASQVLKALRDIGFEDYYQAQQTGWVLYIEGSTDLAILQKLARVLGHPADADLERPFVHYVANDTQRARDHFYGLREAWGSLQGIALFDRLDKPLDKGHLNEAMWRRREIENYLCREEVLIAYARGKQSDDLIREAESELRANTMRDCIRELVKALQTLGKPDPWSPEIKATDDFLDPLFKKYFQTLREYNVMPKSNYSVLVDFITPELLDPEIKEKLDAIHAVASKAGPRT